MRYFHRTSLPPEDVMKATQRYFGARFTPAEEAPRRLAYSGSIGKLRIVVKAEGGHYTFIDIQTDQMGESELDKLAKRFLSEVHQRVEPAHAVRGAY